MNENSINVTWINQKRICISFFSARKEKRPILFFFSHSNLYVHLKILYRISMNAVSILQMKPVVYQIVCATVVVRDVFL